MATILSIETATKVCSVYLGVNGKIVSGKDTQIANSHSEYLTVYIEELLKENNLTSNELDAVAVSMGPGSYTGLRIGLSVAKGLCYAIEKPLIGVPTLQSMAFGAATMQNNAAALFCPMIDARRMEVYSAFYDNNNKEVRGVQADIIEEGAFHEYLEKKEVFFFGDGAEKCSEILGKHTNACFLSNFEMSAKNMLQIAENKFNAKEFEDLAYCEPFYLKEFIAGKPKVKGLK